MRRALLTTTATVVGVAYILNFKVLPHSTAVVTGQSSAPDGSGSAGSPTPSPTAPSPGAAPATPPPSAVVDGTFTGPAVFVRFGDVQVRVVVAGGRVTDVQALELPSDRARSAEISQYSGPILRQEAIRAQSARISVVSGATYTSYGYAQSLEAALQQDHLG